MTPAGIESATFRFVAQHLNHCAAAVHCSWQVGCLYADIQFYVSAGDTRLWWGVLRERASLEDLVVDGRVILKWIFREGIVGVDCEFGNEALRSIKCGEFL